MCIYNKEEYLSHWTQAKRGQRTATQFMGHDLGRIWTGSQWDVVPLSRGNSALYESSASRRGSSHRVPFSPGGLKNMHTEKRNA